MNDLITITGFVATDPRVISTSEGLDITSFRLASSQRRYSKVENAWVDAETNWYTVSTFRQLAANAAGSIRKGDRVIVTGRLRIRSWDTGEKSGTTIEIDAEALGHDIAWGTSSYTRTMSRSEENTPAGTTEQPVEETAEASAATPAGGFEPELQASSQVATPF